MNSIIAARVCALSIWALLSSLACPQVFAKCSDIPALNPPNRKVVISDLHLGPGLEKGPDGAMVWTALEDFRFASTFRNFLTMIGKDGNTDLIIAGDFIDFWQLLYKEDMNRSAEEGPTQALSLRKLERALEAHKETFNDLAVFARQGRNRLIIVPGNHDADLLWPNVQARLRAFLNIQPNEKFFITNSCYQSEGLHVEHGHQLDRANRFKNPDHPFELIGEEQRLETNFGTRFMSRFYNHLEAKRHFVDNLYPEEGVVSWALKNEDLSFLQTQFGNFIGMLKEQKILDQLGLLGDALGGKETSSKPPEKKNVENLLKLYENADPQLGRALRAMLKDPQARTDGERVVNDMSPEEWAFLNAHLRNPKTLGKRLGVEDPLITGARRVVINNPQIEVVVMGHTHEIARTEVTRLSGVGDNKPRWYVNTGCWQKMALVRVAEGARKWKDLKLDDSIFPEKFSYVEVTYQDGKILPPKRSFYP